MADAIRGVSITPTDNQDNINRELIRVINELVARVVAAESQIQYLQRRVD